MIEAPIKELQSVRFRNRGYTGKKLLLPSEEYAFLNFLTRALGENVFLIGTRLGLDVYYLSTTSKASFISKHLWFFQTDKSDKKNSLSMEERNGTAVLDFFDHAVESLSGHPQLFLSTSKKLIARFNDLGIKTPLNKMLYTCFDNQLNRLITEDRVPFSAKIKQLREEKEEPFLKTNDAKQRLLKAFSSRNTTN
ncbi:hypothetical protein [Flavimarina sp. Hel_I_48]|uniref:hypothetical protein n=1 Tax=Flavimarina sp. Hel_I_48 TaxID=1392488 RepID=UPI0004DF794E|nr:hypothetical protein [Flavimarina sp. Hel_I_48]